MANSRPLALINGRISEIPDGNGAEWAVEGASGSVLRVVVATDASYPSIAVDDSRGTLAAKTKTLKDDRLFGLLGRGHDGAAAHTVYAASIEMRALEDGDVGNGTYTDYDNAPPGIASVRTVVFRTATQLTSLRAPLAIRQPAPTVASATATLTTAALLGGIINSLPSSAISLTLPTGALVEAVGPWPSFDLAFDWYVRNGGTAAVTLVAGTSHSLDVVGSSAVVAAGTIAHLRTRYSASGTAITYRL